MADKSKKSSKKKNRDAGKDKKSSKKARAAEREAKKASRKGDGSFPDILVVTTGKDPVTGARPRYFGNPAEDLEGLNTSGQTVAVYKLRRVSTIDIKRKVTR